MPPMVRSPRANLRSESPPQREPFSVGPARKAASFNPSPSPRRRSKNNAENFPPEAAVSDTSLSPALSKPYPKLAKPGHHGSPGLPPRPPAARPPPVPPLSSHVTRPALPSGTIPADFVPAVKRKLKWEGGLHSPSLGETHSLNLPSALDLSDNGVKVIVRIRPMNKKEEQEEAIQIVQRISADCLSLTDQQFTFDTVLGPEASQQAMFEMVGMPLVENCLAGFNSSIFAYGQTGSGKTYTMWGAIADDPVVGAIQLPNEGRGLAPRVFECLFSCMQKEEKNNTQKQLRFQCRCSFLEIYNEQITDLLDPGQKNLQIREAVKTGVYVENLTEEFVSSSDDVVQLLQRGLANRRVGTTNMNAESSRSHTVFTFVIESRCKSIEDGVSSVRRSRMNLVDLAGSERQKLTGAAGERLKEAGNINRSLSQLGNLINILGEASQSGKQRHIPYRDSRLTFLLQESLGGNAKLVMICAVSPANSSQRETMSTLRFAQRAKAIQNKAVVNEERENDVNFLREQIRQLRDELMRMKQNEPGSSSSSSTMGGGNGYSTSWNARRSYNLLKISLSHPLTLPQTDSDSDEEMEIEDDRVESMDVVRCSSSSDEKESVTEKDCELQSAKKNEWGNDAESGNGKEDRFRMEIVAESGDVKEQRRTEIVAETGNEKEQCRGGIVAEILNDEDLCRTENVVENGNNEEQSRSEIVAEAGNAEEQCRTEIVPETGNEKQQCGRIVAEIVNDEDLCRTENVVENGNDEEQRRSEIVAEAGNAEEQCRMEIVPETGKEREQSWVGIVAETEKDKEQWTEVVAENGNDEQCRTENANLQEEAEANPLVSKVLSVPDLNHQEAVVLENDCIFENEIESFKVIEPAENCEHKNGIESSKAMSPAENLRKDESTITEDEASEIVEHITNVITEVSEESSAFKCDRGMQSDFNMQMEEYCLNVESEEEKIIENLAAQEAKKTELVREEVISKESLYGGGSDAKEGNLAENCSAVVVDEGIEFLFNSKLSKAAELEASDVTGLSLNMPKYDEDPHDAEKKVENLINLSVFTKESDAKEESLAEDCSAMVVDDGIEFPFNPKPSEDAELKGSDVTGHRLNMIKRDDPQDADKSLENLIKMSVFTKESDKGSSLDGELHSSETVLSSNGLESNNEVIINDSSCGPELRKSSLRSPVLSISPQLSSPVLESPILSVSPRIRDDGKRRSELTALAETSLQNWHTEEPAAEFKTPLSSGKENLAKKKKASVASSKNMAAASPTERLAASLHRGLQILDNHQLNMNSLRRSSVRFSFQNLEPIKTPPPPPIRGVEKGVQTSPKLFADGDRDKHSSAMETLQVPDDKSKWQLVPVDNPSTPMSQSTPTITHLSKTVEAVLAGAIRREQSAEEALSRKDAELEQLARLVRQYKHERECNQVLQQSREDKIGRLEGLMDGIIPSDAFINEEWVSLVEEHKILQEKYDNHPEVTQANVELQCLRGELEQYRKFFDLGEKEVLLEEIQDLRNQLQYCIDTPRLRKQRQLYLTPAVAVEEEGVCPPQETEGPTMEISTESFEVARKQWEEQEAEWMSTLEELRSEVEACRQLADKRKQELECEQQCSAETREALEMAMVGHARLLDQYADLQEKHIALLAKQRKIKESVAEVKRKAGKAGLKETRFVEAQAAELAAVKLEMEQERMAAKLKIDGLQSQLRDTAEAVQAAGELLVRLKEAEEAVLLAQDSAAIAEQESDALRRKVEKLKRRHATELATLQQRILETRLQRGALCPMCAMAERVKFQFPEVDPLQAQAAMEAEQLAALKEAEAINHHHLHYLEGEDPPLLNPDKDLHHDDGRWYKELGTCNY